MFNPYFGLNHRFGLTERVFFSETLLQTKLVTFKYSGRICTSFSELLREKSSEFFIHLVLSVTLLDSICDSKRATDYIHLVLVVSFVTFNELYKQHLLQPIVKPINTCMVGLLTHVALTLITCF